MEAHFYDGGAAQLARKLRSLAESLEATGSVWGATRDRCEAMASRFCWSSHATRLDDALESAASSTGSRRRTGPLDSAKVADTL